jgi:hypothetical protein
MQETDTEAYADMMCRHILEKRVAPDDLSWDKRGSNGTPIAHFAAEHGLLPDGFDDYGIRSDTGTTVAHILAQHVYLPDEFSNWDWADEDGWTVAHNAAASGHLGLCFTEWGLATVHGTSVIDLFLYTHSRYDPARWEAIAEYTMKHGDTLMKRDIDAIKKAAPEWYMQISVNAGMN